MKLNTSLRLQSVTQWNEDGSQGRTNQTADSNYVLPKGLCRSNGGDSPVSVRI